VPSLQEAGFSAGSRGRGYCSCSVWRRPAGPSTPRARRPRLPGPRPCSASMASAAAGLTLSFSLSGLVTCWFCKGWRTKGCPDHAFSERQLRTFPRVTPGLPARRGIGRRVLGSLCPMCPVPPARTGPRSPFFCKLRQIGSTCPLHWPPPNPYYTSDKQCTQK
jgi:hypothetical protein